MTRRLFLLTPACLAAQPASPRNKVADAGNAFHAQWVAWSDAWNADLGPGVLPSRIVAAHEPLPGLWRTFERKFRDWVGL